MEQSFRYRVGILYGRHSKLFKVIAIFVVLWVAIMWIGSFYPPFSPKVLLSKNSADALKQGILSFGIAAPVFFIGLQVCQVVAAPIPGQAAGFAGGYIFGWRLGILFTMAGLAIGSWLVFVLSRTLGRGFVERLNGGAALREFEDLFLNEQGRDKSFYGKSKSVVGAHGLLTFFIIMLLPGLPDDLVCFIGGLTGIPIRKLMVATIAGRFPGMLVLSMVGDGFSKAQSNTVFFLFIAITLALTVIYYWKHQQIEGCMRKAAGLQPTK